VILVVVDGLWQFAAQDLLDDRSAPLQEPFDPLASRGSGRALQETTVARTGHRISRLGHTDQSMEGGEG
jgi:hypothetical protein